MIARQQDCLDGALDLRITVPTSGGTPGRTCSTASGSDIWCWMRTCATVLPEEFHELLAIVLAERVEELTLRRRGQVEQGVISDLTRSRKPEGVRRRVPLLPERLRRRLLMRPIRPKQASVGGRQARVVRFRR